MRQHPVIRRPDIACFIEILADEIRIDRGAAQGVAVGWKGAVESRDGKAIPGGSFEVSRVTAAESFGTVRAPADSVTQAKYVRLRPP